MPKTPKLRVPIVPMPPTEERWVYGCHFTVSELDQLRQGIVPAHLLPFFEHAYVVLTGK